MGYLNLALSPEWKATGSDVIAYTNCFLTFITRLLLASELPFR